MKTEYRHFAVGLFLIAGFALFVLGCIFFGGSELFTRKICFETYFRDSVQGLDVGGAVKFRGMRIGSVESVTLTNAAYADALAERHLDAESDAADAMLSYVRVVCSVNVDKNPTFDEAGLRRKLKRGLVTNLAMQGITGVLFVDLDFDPTVKPYPIAWESEHLYIPAKSSQLKNIITSIDAVAENLRSVNFSAVVSEIRTLTQTLNGTLRDAKIKELSESFRSLSDSLRTQSDRVGEILTRLDRETLPSFSRRLNATADDTRAALADFRKALANADALLKTATQTFASADSALKTADNTLKAADERLNDPTAREDLSRTLLDLSRAVRSLEALTEALRDDPSSLIWGAAEE